MALLDSQVAVLANQALNYLVGGKAPARLGNAHPNIVPYQTFATADGHIIMAVGTDRQFKEYCTIIGVPHLAEDPQFRTNRGRVENRATLIPLLVEPMKARTTAQWVEAFEAAAVPCGPINTIDQVFANAQVLARGLQIGLTRDDGVQVPGVANPDPVLGHGDRIRQGAAALRRRHRQGAAGGAGLRCFTHSSTPQGRNHRIGET